MAISKVDKAILNALALWEERKQKVLQREKLFIIQQTTQAGSNNEALSNTTDTEVESSSNQSPEDGTVQEINADTCNLPAMKMKNELLLSSETKSVDFPRFPCHTQAVERVIKLVTDSLRPVWCSEARKGFIKSRITLQKSMPKFETKKHFT
ncbi:hypothetical protein ILUMI_25805, partial [Ignelater luminosus]